MRNNHFEVIGMDLRSISYVNELSAYAVQIAQRYLDREGLAFPRTILISLRPEGSVDFEGDYRIQVAERSSVLLDLRWESSMTLEVACRAITEALLLQYALYNYGKEAAFNLRTWAVAALAGEVYYALRPAQFVELLQRSRANPDLLLSPLLESALRERDSSIEETSAYWIISAMKSSRLERPVIRSLFQQALAGINIETALTAAVQPLAPTAEPVSGQAWFSAQLEQLLGQEHDVIEAMNVSRDWLSALVRLEAPLVLESGEVTLNLRTLWKYRAEPQVQEFIQARYEILRLRMSRINPAYFNPARSLGVLFEGILSDAPSYKYLHSLTIYLSDWEDAKEMQEEIERRL
ncbi:hypothetical protein QEH59_14995 [Coraliomargarita sp. SDUM461004]|uniref:Uncharacterized protein n=1 Tax=Thalassobacterium sedimentorum TaxID=3041258 RepID=A0ABU1ALQ3_9BACT|nr:hypothetical protein [Coraliomargarita sp. SDUM461004]MDQ8195737.1 hypothetical protein [Coraliomargarita sp. SDUM461004]